MDSVIPRLDFFFFFFFFSLKKRKENTIFLSVATPKKEICSPQLSFFFNSVIHCETDIRWICI